jgi:hypothetical protein
VHDTTNSGPKDLTPPVTTKLTSGKYFLDARACLPSCNIQGCHPETTLLKIGNNAKLSLIEISTSSLLFYDSTITSRTGVQFDSNSRHVMMERSEPYLLH